MKKKNCWEMEKTYYFSNLRKKIIFIIFQNYCFFKDFFNWIFFKVVFLLLTPPCHNMSFGRPILFLFFSEWSVCLFSIILCLHINNKMVYPELFLPWFFHRCDYGCITLYVPKNRKKDHFAGISSKMEAIFGKNSKKFWILTFT